MDVTQFRKDFPEFADPNRYTLGMVTLWSTLGERLVKDTRLGDMRPMAVQLFTAHNIALAYSNAKAGAAGGSPGMTSGRVTSKSVGDVSVTYDASAGIITGAGHWNLTTYGVQFLQLVELVGMGALQL